MPGPLGGIKVFEIAHIMAGPVCGMMLADLGADVVKIEPVDGGDPTRTFGTGGTGDAPGPFMMLNRNKRGIAVDLKTDEGRVLAQKLLSTADVVIENFRGGTMERLGLGYETLEAANPGLIFCEISGYGRTGPMADRGGFDLIAQGYSGLMSITGESAARPPVKIGAPVTDITAGILGALGVLGAVIERQRTGKGQRVDTSLFEAGVTHTLWHSAIALAGGTSPGPLGSAHPLTAPYQAFQTSDGWITVGASNQATWLRLLEALGRRDLQDDERFTTNSARLAHRHDLEPLLAAIFAGKETETWIGILDAARVPAGPVQSIDEMLAHPHTLARDMVTEVGHAAAGRIKTIGSAIKFNRRNAEITRGAPLLGQHTREVLAEHGVQDDDIDRLVRSGVIKASGA